MKNLILFALLLSQVALAKTANQVQVMPNSGNIPVWGQVDLSKPAAVTNSLTGGQISNVSVAASVATSALTVALKGNDGNNCSSTNICTIAFRSATATDGTWVSRTVTGALSVVVSSGSTLGTQSTVLAGLYVYALDNSGTVELAISSSPFDERYVQSTTAEGGAGAADSNALLYSTAARTSKAIRLLAVMQATEATAGTWATAPSAVSRQTQPHPISWMPLRQYAPTVGAGGFGLSTSSGTSCRTALSYADVTNLSVTITTTGRPVDIYIRPDGIVAGNLQVVCTTASTGCSGTWAFLRDATTIGEQILQFQDTAGGTTRPQALTVPAMLGTTDFVAAGTYTYKLQQKFSGNNANSGVCTNNVQLVAVER